MPTFDWGDTDDRPKLAPSASIMSDRPAITKGRRSLCPMKRRVTKCPGHVSGLRTYLSPYQFHLRRATHAAKRMGFLVSPTETTMGLAKHDSLLPGVFVLAAVALHLPAALAPSLLIGLRLIVLILALLGGHR